MLVNAEPNSDYLINDQYSQSTYGGIGLIQTPTASFSNDGEFGFGVSSEAPIQSTICKNAVFPMDGSSFKIYGRHHLPYYGDHGSNQTWKDKGLDIKIRLFEEETNSGLELAWVHDIGGTGAYSSEYLVASKHFKNIDWSIGLGWGRLGGVDHLNNIIGWLDNDRKDKGWLFSLWEEK